MKKTIAKLMAAAMLLSAVPAVTMPGFVAKAQTLDSVTPSTTQTVLTVDQLKNQTGKFDIASDGTLLRFALGDRATYTDLSFAATGSAIDDLINVTPSLNNGVITVKASAKANLTSAQNRSITSAVKSGNNWFKIKITNKSRSTQNGAFNGDEANGVTITEVQFPFGGQFVNNRFETGVYDEDNLLVDRDVYAIIKNETDPEVEIIAGQKTGDKNQIANNDALRGQLLKLNTVNIGGRSYKVVRLGSQALKEAHMKKIQLKNCQRVGKGALRKCKNVKNVNLKDKNKVRKIHNKAFYGCKNLRSIAIDARKLNTVGKDAFKNVHKNCKIKIKASKSKYNDVVKKIKKSGAKNVKYSRLNP